MSVVILWDLHTMPVPSGCSVASVHRCLMACVDECAVNTHVDTHAFLGGELRVEEHETLLGTLRPGGAAWDRALST